MKTTNKTRRLVLMAMFAALAYVIMLVGRIPITSVDFLKYDPKDFVIVISGFVLGPIPALLITLVVSLIEMITASTTGFIGLVMNILATGLFACTAAAFYTRKRTLRSAIVGLVIGVLLMTGMMLLWNYFITPLYMGTPREVVAGMLVPVFLPFNLIKGSINAALAVLIYKPVSRALKQSGMIEGHKQAAPVAKKRSIGVYIIAGVVLASCILAVLVMRGII